MSPHCQARGRSAMRRVSWQRRRRNSGSASTSAATPASAGSRSLPGSRGATGCLSLVTQWTAFLMDLCSCIGAVVLAVSAKSLMASAPLSLGASIGLPSLISLGPSSPGQLFTQDGAASGWRAGSQCCPPFSWAGCCAASSRSSFTIRPLRFPPFCPGHCGNRPGLADVHGGDADGLAEPADAPLHGRRPQRPGRQGLHDDGPRLPQTPPPLQHRPQALRRSPCPHPAGHGRRKAGLQSREAWEELVGTGRPVGERFPELTHHQVQEQRQEKQEEERSDAQRKE